VSDRHVRALREAARRSRGRLADFAPRRPEGDGPAASRRAGLERTVQRAAARLAAAEAGRRRAADRDAAPRGDAEAGPASD
jgi:hypothetical protein